MSSTPTDLTSPDSLPPAAVVTPDPEAVVAPATTPASGVAVEPTIEPAIAALTASDEPGAAPAPAQPVRREMSLTEVAEALKTRFPALFKGAPKPLKLRIQVDIQEQAPGVFPKQALSAFFRRYTASYGYLQAVTRAPHRFDLAGQPAGEITEEHRQVAATELTRRRTLQNERQEQEMAERQRRAALLRDFERTTLSLANFCSLKGLTQEALDAELATARREAAEAPPAPLHARRDGRPPRRDPGQQPRRTDGPRHEGPRGGRNDAPGGARRQGEGRGRPR